MRVFWIWMSASSLHQADQDFFALSSGNTRSRAASGRNLAHHKVDCNFNLEMVVPERQVRRTAFSVNRDGAAIPNCVRACCSN